MEDYEYSRNSELKREDQWLRPKLFNFLQKFKTRAFKLRKDISYELLHDSFFFALDYLLPIERDIIDDYFLDNFSEKKIAKLFDGMRDCEFIFYLETIKKKMEVFMCHELKTLSPFSRLV